MAFSNIQIHTEHLPRIGEISWKPLKSDYRLVSLIGEAIFWLILFSLATFILFLKSDEISRGMSLSILLVIVTLSILRLLTVFFAFRHKGFAIREQDVLYKKGLFWKTQTSIPFNRVQHCEVKQGPIERMFDLAQLIVYTAGGSTSDLRVPGLEPTEANSIKHFILDKSGSSVEEEE